MHHEDGRHGNEDGRRGYEDRLHAGKSPDLFCDIRVRHRLPFAIGDSPGVEVFQNVCFLCLFCNKKALIFYFLPVSFFLLSVYRGLENQNDGLG